MKADQLGQIVERFQAAPAAFEPHVHSYGPVVVMISCTNVRQAEALAELLRHVRTDMAALLKEIRVEVEPAQLAMELE